MGPVRVARRRDGSPTRSAEGDHAILLSDRRHLEAVERLFPRIPLGSIRVPQKRTFGLLLAFFGATYLLPSPRSIFTGDGLALYFLVGGKRAPEPGCCSGRDDGTGASQAQTDSCRDVGWIATSALATIPLLMACLTHVHSGVLETMSGLTRRVHGLVGLDNLQPSLNFWRHELE
jgi:hypothetical protein